MMGAHSCGDLIDVDTSHTPERSPTATLAKRAYYHHHLIIIIIIMLIDLIWLSYTVIYNIDSSAQRVTTAG
jgi:hypothetical protein